MFYVDAARRVYTNLFTEVPTATNEELMARHQSLTAAFQQALKDRTACREQVAISGNNVSHLWRPRTVPQSAIDVTELSRVLHIDTDSKIAHVEGMITFDALVDATLKMGLRPKVVPELRGITVGGAISGLAIESSSFRYGLFHRAVTEMEVLTGNGDVVVCTKDNEYKDLFFGMPNSFGTLGYVLSAKIELVEAKPYVALHYQTFTDRVVFFDSLRQACNDPANDFVDGVIFNANQMILVTGRGKCTAPEAPSDYVCSGIYHKAISEKKRDCLTIRDYLWRWDTDSFWSTRGTPLENPVIRNTLGPMVLRSDILKRIKQEMKRLQPHRPIAPPYKEELIQDVGIPIGRCSDFFDWFEGAIGIFPIFICPARAEPAGESCPLWPVEPGSLFCDFGFFGSKPTPHEPGVGFFNQLVEEAVPEHGGLKSLYSRTYYGKEEFKRLYYGDGAYDALKAKYDRDGALKGLYEKCVLSSR